MSKIRCVVSAPVDSYSGYGKRSFDFVKELLRIRPDWDISILSQRWGDCRMGFLEDHEEYEVLTHIVSNLTFTPDVWIQITVPNEFQPVGKYNIGITAAMETTLCDSSWVLGCNRMNLVLTSSNHGKFSLLNSKYLDNTTQKTLEVEIPLEVLFEGLDTDRFYPTKPYKADALAGLDTDWNFLCVGHWLPGDFGEDRKNIGYTIKMFLETFKDWSGKAPGLVLKVTRGTNSVMDREEVLSRIYDIQETVKYSKSLPKVYLLHGDLTDDELNEVYNDPRIKALVSFTKGEGFGRPFLEFAAVGKPILCSGWSGQMDFLDKDQTAFVGGTIEKVHPSATVAHMILPDASWFKPNSSHVVAGFREIFGNYATWLPKARKQSRTVNKLYTRGKMGEKMDELFTRYLPDFPEEVDFVLPKLDSIIDNGD